VRPEEVREFLTVMAKSGLLGGIYLWINKRNAKLYVGSSINLHSRVNFYFSLKNVHGIIGQALLKYGLLGFILVIFLVPGATVPLVLFLEQSLRPVVDGCVCAYNAHRTLPFFQVGNYVALEKTREDLLLVLNIPRKLRQRFLLLIRGRPPLIRGRSTPMEQNRKSLLL
jgi:hypothetical protein